MQTVHRPSSGGRAGALAKAFLVLIVLGVAAGGAYRYYKLGYLLQAPPPKPVAVDFVVSPASAEILVDDEPLTTRPLMAEPGQRYQIEFRAPGRLTVRRVVLNPEKNTAQLTVRLPHGLGAMTRDHAAIEPAQLPKPAGETAAVDAALDKLELYEKCVDGMREPRRRSQDAYAASTRKGKPSRKHVPNVVVIDSALRDECGLRVEEAGEREPPMKDIEARGLAYLDAIAELVPMVRITAGYYAKREYEQDQFKYGRKTHPTLVSAYERSETAERALAEAIVAHRLAWAALELRVVEDTIGKSALWHLRNVALRGETWVGRAVSEASNETVAAARGAFVATLHEADAYAESHPDEIDALPGAVEYLRGLASLRQLAAKDELDSKDRSEILAWHNQSVELFNRIVVAR
jgi:hypothetical protein